MEEMNYKNQAVRDLAWTIGGRGYMTAEACPEDVVVFSDSWYAQQLELHQNWLWEVDAAPGKLLNFLAGQPAHRLGKYFERLIEFWLINSPHFDLIGCNLQVNDATRTIGEFDFLFTELATGRTFHAEVALKYYMQHQVGDTAWNKWIGPNAKDTLHRKMHQLLDQQLKLSETVAGKTLLQEKGIASLETALFMKGYFFGCQSAQENAVASLPQYANGLAGNWWCKISELNGGRLVAYKNWVIVPRHLWISPVQQSDLEVTGKTTLSEKVMTEMERIGGAVMLAHLNLNNESKSEEFRLMVVADDWPIQA